MPKSPTDPLRSLLMSWLPARRNRMRQLGLASLWQRLADYCAGGTRPLRLNLHGQRVLINPGNIYPFLIVEFPHFNRPLVEFVRQVHSKLARPLATIDIGASIGNTALLLMAECGPMIRRLHSVEGDTGFFHLLEQNTAQFPKVTRYLAMLAREPGMTRSLVHHHPGTAGAMGNTTVSATTLDELILSRESRFDFLKIDVDGSDGEVLVGARKLLARDQPAVIFEWHPFLIKQAGNDPFAAFVALREHHYETLLCFNNSGTFSHFSHGSDWELERWQRYLLAMHPHGDPHFDVIALPPGLRDLELSLASFGITR